MRSARGTGGKPYGGDAEEIHRLGHLFAAAEDMRGACEFAIERVFSVGTEAVTDYDWIKAHGMLTAAIAKAGRD